MAFLLFHFVIASAFYLMIKRNLQIQWHVLGRIFHGMLRLEISRNAFF